MLQIAISTTGGGKPTHLHSDITTTINNKIFSLSGVNL
jgi:hypothetical protein